METMEKKPDEIYMYTTVWYMYLSEERGGMSVSVWFGPSKWSPALNSHQGDMKTEFV